jgi:hypothetical protein
MWKRALVVATVVAASLGGAAITLGAIPGTSGVISGCYAKSTGSLRVVDTEAGASCDARKESALSWNQKGPAGPQGPPGPPGVVATHEVIASTSAVQDTYGAST